MGAALKVLIGLVLILIGLGLFADSILGVLPGKLHRPWLDSFIVVVQGVVPIFLILLGLLVVWLEVDEIKMEKELKKEDVKHKEEVKPSKEPKAKKK
jgi:hypothetical protein